MKVEDDRLAALRGLAVPDTAPGAEFDSLARGASTACGTPPTAEDSSVADGTANGAVLDQDSLAQLARVIGPARLATMLRTFTADLEGRLDNLAHMPDKQLLSCAHGWISMAGHFGFVELQRRATDLQTAARAGRAAAHVGALRDAAERALLAAKACRFTPAA